MPVTLANVDDVLKYHRPDEASIVQIGKIREAANHMIRAILIHTPSCADQQAAIRHVREAMMTANAAIVLDGKV